MECVVKIHKRQADGKGSIYGSVSNVNGHQESNGHPSDV